MVATLEVYRGGHWLPAATLAPLDEAAGVGGASLFEYLLDYAIDYAGPETAETAGLSFRFPADFRQYRLDHWPPFILDLLPSGHGRRQWLEHLGLRDGPSADWPLLLRGDRAADRKVLRNEAAYMRVADRLGLNVFAELEWEGDNLFVPRFDRRVRDGAVERYGMESLYSAAGVAEYGARTSHELLCAAILEFSSRPDTDLLEYIKRDIVNVVMGNKDNHGRNTALLRHENGRVELAPVFDFAPMYLDPEGIARVCRWSGDVESAGDPDWGRVIELFPDRVSALRGELRNFGQRLRRLPDIMHGCGVDDDIVEFRSRSIESHSRQLVAL